MNVLVVVDMQNDFIDGALGTAEAVSIVPLVVQKIRSFDGLVLATMDTHSSDYSKTQEGRRLPVAHCIKGSDGWQIAEAIRTLLTEAPIEKPTFGSIRLGERLLELHQSCGIEEVTFVGLCTDICVISNAMIAKAFLPEVPIVVDAACCAGVTPESHKQALEAMKMCQVRVINDGKDA